MRRAVVLAVLAALAVPAATAAVRPPQIYCLKQSERKRAIWFSAGDGTKLAGLVLGAGRRGVVLAHTSDGSICESLPQARRYAAAGYRVLAIDMRAHGYSARSARRPNAYDSDVAGAVREVRKRGATKVVVVGASLGALAGLVAGPRLAVDGIVSLSSPGAYAGLDAIAAAPKQRVPVLYASAEEDQNGPFDFAADARKLHDATPGEKALVLVPGNAHGWPLLADAGTRATVDAFIRARFA